MSSPVDVGTLLGSVFNGIMTALQTLLDVFVQNAPLIIGLAITGAVIYSGTRYVVKAIREFTSAFTGWLR